MKKAKKLTVLIAACFLSFIAAITLIAYNGASNKAFAAESAKIEMVDGAEIRVADENASGLRFIGKVDKSLFKNVETPELNDGVTVGMLTVPESMLTGDLTTDTAGVSNTVIQKWDSGRSDNTFMRFNVAITEIPQEYYGTTVVARAYVTENGSTTYSAKTVTRSVAQVASAALADGETDERGIVKGFVDGVNPVLGVKINGTAVELSSLNGKKLELNDKIEFSVSPSNLTIKYEGTENNFKKTATNSYLAAVSGSVNFNISLGSISENAAIEVSASDMSFGIGEVTSELYNTLADSGKTAERVANAYGVMGATTTRVWIYQGYFFGTNDNDDIWLNQGNVAKLHAYLNELKANGVVNVIGMVCEYLKPAKFNETVAEGVGKGSSVPLPADENYQKFLDLNTAAYYLLAREFPEIVYWEAGNEPSMTEWFHDKNGAAIDSQTTAHIVADYCFAARKGVKMASSLNKLVTPGLVYGDTLNTFLGELYDYIAAKENNNPGDYFDYLAWHPYPHATTDGTVSNFINTEKALFEIVNERDPGRQVIYTEFGFSDERFKDNVSQEQVANYAVNAMRGIKADAQLKDFVKSVVWFRLADNLSAENESSYGLFTSPDAKTNAFVAKPIAEELYKYYNGTDDVSALKSLQIITDPTDLSIKHLSGIVPTGIVPPAGYTMTEVTEGFITSGAKVGLKIVGNGSGNSAVFSTPTNVSIENGKTYRYKYSIEGESGNWARTFFGIKDLMKYSATTAFPPNVWSFSTGNYAYNNITIISQSHPTSSSGNIYSGEIVFMANTSIDNVEISFMFQGSIDVIITEMSIKEYGASALSKKHLSGVIATDIVPPTGFTMTEITSGFTAENAEVGLKISGTCSTTNTAVFSAPTNVSLESGKTYRYKYTIEGSGAWAQTFFGIKDIFTYPNATFPPNVWAYNYNLGLKNATLVSRTNSKDSTGTIYSGEVVFTANTSIDTVIISFMFQNTIDVIITEMSITEVIE